MTAKRPISYASRKIWRGQPGDAAWAARRQKKPAAGRLPAE